ncbi:MAG TPA: hypothetical protein VJ505_08015 [Holophagaceae bacterium]|nr:hypothetical protein [Holophagaceae bacterium]
MTLNDPIHRFLEAMVQLQSDLSDFHQVIRAKAEVVDSTLYKFTPRAQAGDAFASGEAGQWLGDEFGLSAELESGTLIDWWIEVWSSAAGWSVSAKVYVRGPEDEEREVGVKVLDLRTDSSSEALTALKSLAADLIAANVPGLGDSGNP